VIKCHLENKPKKGLLKFFQILVLTTASRPTLGPTKLPTQRVTGALYLGVKRPGREADHSLPSSAKVKECVELYLHFPNTPSWHGAQLKINTGTTLPLLQVCLRSRFLLENLRIAPMIKKFLAFLLNSKSHYLHHILLPQDHILNQINLVNSLKHHSHLW
jgi:hypothetical protein